MYIKIAEKKDYKNFINFQKNLYKDDINYKDFQSKFLKSLLYKKSCLLKSSKIKPVMVMDNKSIIGVCLLCIVDRMNDTLQISFLDFIDNKDVFKLIFDYSKTIAKKKGLKKILIGMNLHINYGLGLLANKYDMPQDLGSSYNYEYYIKHIESFISPSEQLISYKGLISDIDLSLSEKSKQRLYNSFSIKKADFKNIEKTAKVYSYVNNLAFKNHKYYFERRNEEDIELFKDFRFLLDEHNLLFVYHDEKPVGFLLWYPDFNQIVNSGKDINISTILKYKLNLQKIDTMIIAEFGVIPQYQKKGALYALLDTCYNIAGKKYKYIKSGWIMEKNINSKIISKRFIKNEYKKYKVFEIQI